MDENLAIGDVLAAYPGDWHTSRVEPFENSGFSGARPLEASRRGGAALPCASGPPSILRASDWNSFKQCCGM